MNIELKKSDLINLVNSTQPGINECIELTKTNKMEQTGNQHNYGWKWSLEYLNTLSENYLYNLYLKYK